MTFNRIYNHTDRQLIVLTGKPADLPYGPSIEKHLLLPQCVSPHDAGQLAAVCYEANLWALTGDSDVHVTEIGVDSSIGAGNPEVDNPTGTDADLCVFGLGVAKSTAYDDTRTKPAVDAWFYREDEIWVTVLGAGITGLSAAHELVTRGFRVQVIERAHSSPTDSVKNEPKDLPSPQRFHRGLRSPDVGGIARTQWATQPLERAATGLGFGTAQNQQPSASSGVATKPIPREPKILESLHSVHGDAIWFGPTNIGEQRTSNYFAFAVGYDDTSITTNVEKELPAWLAKLAKLRSLAGIQLVVVIYGSDDRAAAVKAAYKRLDQFVAAIPAKDPFEHLQVLPTARMNVVDTEPAGTNRVGLIVRVHDDLGLIAGEHGFRFFPGFYRHLRDTMGRTPVYDAQTETFTPRTALDNLQEVEWQVIADPTRRQQTPFARRPFTTIGGLVEQYRTLRRDIGYRPSDLLRFTLRILRYATSSTYRREKLYESMSWWDFLSLRYLDVNPKGQANAGRLPYGARFKEALIHSPKALVAMGSEFADARTQGNLSVQLLMDQFGLHDQGDSTLNGPTSTAWLANWKTYLQEQGVQFFLGEVTKISHDASKAGVIVDIKFPLTPETELPKTTDRKVLEPIGYFDPVILEGKVGAHYYLSALDVANLATVTKELRSTASAFADLNKLVLAPNGDDRDLENIAEVGQSSTAASPSQGLGDRFQTLTGIQLYYERHVSFANGHMYFAESPWGLSAISQVQFWGPFGSGHRGRLTGNLSIDIGSWRRDARNDKAKDGTPKIGAELAALTAADKVADNLDPNTLERDAIAHGVERQIDRCTRNPGNGLRQARYYHLDDFIGFAAVARDGKPAYLPSRNYAPFLINVTGDWCNRPVGKP